MLGHRSVNTTSEVEGQIFTYDTRGISISPRPSSAKNHRRRSESLPVLPQRNHDRLPNGIAHLKDSRALQPVLLSTCRLCPGASACAKKLLRNAIAPSQSQKIYQHQSQPSPTRRFTATKAPPSALLRCFTIRITETEAMLRALVHHVPSTRLRTDFIPPSLLRRSLRGLIASRLWG